MDSTPLSIWLVSLFDPTPLDQPISPRFIGIAEAAAEMEHKVIHFTSTFWHTKKEHRFDENKVFDINENYEVAFIHSKSYKKNISIRRSLAHWDFAVKLIEAFDQRPKPDLIFISMPPLSTIAKVTRWAKEKNIPVVIDIIDPWPDSFIKDVPESIKFIGRFLLKPFYKKLENAFAHASAITAISRQYLKWASAHHDSDKPTSPFHLAIDVEEFSQQIQSHRPPIQQGKATLNLIYAGSLASSYDIPCILKAARILDIDCPGQTKFTITGNGPQKELIYEFLKSTSNIEYLGYVSKEELFRQYAIADIGLIQHKNSLTQTITYKFFNYLAAGLPILNSLQGEMADLIRENNLGLNNREGNVSNLVNNIKKYLFEPSLLERQKTKALSFAKRYGDNKSVYRDLVLFLESIVSQSQSSRKEINFAKSKATGNG